MKTIKRYLAFAVVLSLFMVGCSTEETSQNANTSSETAVLSFGTVLNDFSRQQLSKMNKAHFDQVPTCSDATPAFARVSISYADVTKTVDVEILSDGESFYTDYSGDLEIPVEVSNDGDDSNDFTTVSLEEFMVYDGDPDDNGELIWVAPVATEETNFSGYVNNPLPFDITLRPGVKKYVDVEVLCFDRRMVNQYGYLFFDLIPQQIYPICFFANYCDDNGRHFVANYGIDLFLGTGENRVQLYTSNDTHSNVGDYNEDNEEDAEYYADPLCLVIPGPPEGVGPDEDYLYYVVTPLDWEENYGDIDNTPLEEVGLSWNEVQTLLNNDGETNEYLHLFINCEDNEGGDNGDNQDDDGDGVPNTMDECPNTPNGVYVNEVGCPDSDGDGVYDNEDECPNEKPVTDEDHDGCEDEDPDPSDCTIADIEDFNTCFRVVSPGDASEDYDNNGEFLMISDNANGFPIPLLEDLGNGYAPAGGTFTPSVSNDGSFTFNIVPAEGLTTTAYKVEVKDSEGGEIYCTTSGESIMGTFNYPIYIRVQTNMCEQ